MTKECCYSGPASGVTLSDGTEILFWLGKTASLLKEHGCVKALVALKHLTPEPEDTKPTVTPAVQLPKHRSSSDSGVKMEDARGNQLSA